MRADVDREMERRDLEAIIVCGGPASSWETAYLVGPLRVTEGYVFKRRGEEPVFICLPMERHEAAQGGAEIQSYDKLGITAIRRSGQQPAAREAAIIERILEHYGCRGHVELHGCGPIALYGETLRILRERRPQQFTGSGEAPSALEASRITKDEDELARIERVGLRAQDVYRNTLNYLTTLIGDSGKVFDIEGEPILVGDIRDLVEREAGRRRIDVPVEVIFSQGALSAIPHNRGDASEVVRTGVPVVFDLVTRERRSGYHFEIARTFCIGKASSRFETIFRIVEEAQDLALSELRPGRTAAAIDAAVSEFFEGHGYPTLRTDAHSERGAIHYSGHGIGLQLFEEPNLGPVESTVEIAPGMVITIEPGLYLPEEGIGVRIGDVAVIDRDGAPRLLDNITRDPLVPLSR